MLAHLALAALTASLALALAQSASAQFFPNELSIALVPPPEQQQFAQFNSAPPAPQQPQPQQLQLQQRQFAAPPQPLLPRPQQAFVPSPQQNYAHRAVVQNAQREAQLPPQLLNPFYKNQRVAGALAKESWFQPGENLVVDREAEKIPRDRIYKALKDAGFVNRRRR